jgi:hypothetical protein
LATVGSGTALSIASSFAKASLSTGRVYARAVRRGPLLSRAHAHSFQLPHGARVTNTRTYIACTHTTIKRGCAHALGLPADVLEEDLDAVADGAHVLDLLDIPEKIYIYVVTN